MPEIDHGFTTDMKYAIAGTFTGGLSSKGYKLFKKNTEDSWYCVNKVYAVCPEDKKVEGDPTFPNLKSLPEPVDVVIVVHKKEKTIEIVEEAASLPNRPSIWFMPGTISSEALAIIEGNNMKYGSSCMMGHRKIPGWKRFVNMHFFHSKVARMKRIEKQC